MPAEPFKTVPIPFLTRGFVTARPVDQLQPGEYAILRNVRSYQLGSLQTRDGTDNLGTVVNGQSPVHSIRRLNDSINNTWTRVIGTGTHLAYGQTSFTDLGGGWSGNPLALVPWRPNESPLPWMYVADSNQMAKVNSQGTKHGVGIPFVNKAPSIRIADAGVYPPIETSTTIIVYANTQTTTGWSQGGTAGAISLLSVGPGYRVNTTISSIIYFNGAGPGVCSIVPASIANIGQDSTIFFPSNSETQRVLQVLPAASSTTIASILYDSGSTGACSISLTAATIQILKNSVLQIGSGGTMDTVLVTDVVVSNQGQYSIRVSTTHNHVAGETVVGLASFITATDITYPPTTVITCDGLRSIISTGTGGFIYSIAESILQLGNGTLQPDDYVHISVRTGGLTNLIEGKVMFDVDSITNDFTHNFYYYSFRPNDLIQSALGTYTLVQSKTVGITNTQVDSSNIHQPAAVDKPLTALPVNPQYRVPGTPLSLPQNDIGQTDINIGAPNQTQLGQNQFLELVFRLSDLIRVGTDQSRNLNNVQKVQIQFTVNANSTFDITSAWVGGFYGPDIGNLGQPLLYRVQYRSSTTGARSPFSPPTRTGVVPRRNPVEVDYPFSTTAECDKADIYRFGGTLLQWTYVGTGTNNPAGGTGTYIDVQSDTALDASQLGNPDWYQPWPIEDQPKTGTTGIVAGSSIQDSGTNFNTAWAQGTLILINGYAATIYRVISTSLLETYENLGSQTAVSWEVPNPILIGQPLPCMWGPFENFFMACGDPKNPGRLYFSRGNDPDSTQEEYWLDITSPSEALINGFMYNGTCFVDTSERRFRIYPTFGQFNLIDPTIPGPGLFRAIEVPNGKGTFMRWGLIQSATPGPLIWNIGKDGIYQSDGGASQNITNDDHYPLFPHEGSTGIAINGYNPPNLIQAQATNHRLAYYDSSLYYDYIDTLGNRCTLIRKMPAPTDKQATPTGWWFDSYTPGAVMHYGEEGLNVHNLLIGNADGTISQYDSADGLDGTNPVACQYRTGSNDLGDTRIKKVFGDLNFDTNTNNIAVTVEPGVDNFSLILPSTVVNTASRLSDPPIVELETGFEGRNIALDVSWSQTTDTDVICYSWTPTAIPKPENIVLRASDWDDAGYAGNKFVQGCVLELNTYNNIKQLQIEMDGGAIATPTQTVQTLTQQMIGLSWTPFSSHLMRIQCLDSAQWELFSVRWVYNPAPESVEFWETQTRPINGHGYGHIRDGYVTIVSTAPVTIQVIVDGVAYPVFDGDTGASSIPSTGGIQLKKYVIFQPVKGKIIRYNLTSTAPFQLFQDSSEIRVRSWGEEGPYESLKPFGDLSNLTGARI